MDASNYICGTLTFLRFHGNDLCMSQMFVHMRLYSRPLQILPFTARQDCYCTSFVTSVANQPMTMSLSCKLLALHHIYIYMSVHKSALKLFKLSTLSKNESKNANVNTLKLPFTS